MLLKPMNLLILDEPTNHLDLYSKDILLDTLKKFSGTIIFVSHDRTFMEALSTKTLELRSGSGLGTGGGAGKHRLFYGNYGYYLERIEREENGSDIVDVTGSIAAGVSSNNEAAGSGPAAEPRGAAKQKQALVRRLERQEGEIFAELEALEAEKAALEADLGKPEVYSSGGKARSVKVRLDGVTAALEGKSREWEAKAEELEAARQ
jgi:ATP-binding cassette subfamily F protein 3